MEMGKKRYTISVPKELETKLTDIKESVYCNHSQSEMVRDLIARGLDAWKASHCDLH